MIRSTCSLLVVLLLAAAAPAATRADNPYDAQVRTFRTMLSAAAAPQRAWAAEALGHMRAPAAESDLITALGDRSPAVRKEAALALSWCGSRKALPALLAALDDRDSLVRQSAHAALLNLSGMDFPFDALADEPARQTQRDAWKRWIAALPADQAPSDLLAMLGQAPPAAGNPLNLAANCVAAVSSIYRGSGTELTDGDMQGFWQTKQVPFPQSCTIDLGKGLAFGQIVVHQYGPGFEMTDYELSVSDDGKTFRSLTRRKAKSDVELEIDIPPTQARFVRITSHAALNRTYPTTFREVEVFAKPRPPSARGRKTDDPPQTLPAIQDAHRQERAMRALGFLGGSGAAQAVAGALGPPKRWPGRLSQDRKSILRGGLRALGRIGGDAAFDTLVTYLDAPDWARYAAEALGDLGDARAVPLLIDRYPRFARDLAGKEPTLTPVDDRENFPSRDRMPETAFHFLLALCRLIDDSPAHAQALRPIAPIIVANLPQDYDGMVLYEQESTQLLSRHLLELAGLRQEAVEAAFEALGQPRRLPVPPGAPAMPATLNKKGLYYEEARVAVWLPALVADGADLPRLLALVDHKNRWVGLNAAKAVGYLGDERAVKPLADLLSNTRNEAAYGFSPKFIDEEFNDPTPRLREAVVRSLGMLQARPHAALLGSVLHDEGTVLEVRLAAVEALAQIDSPAATDALRRAALSNGYYTVRMYARDALRRRGLDAPPPTLAAAAPSAPLTVQPPEEGFPNAVVFIRGDNALPNYFQNDCWRQAYVTTDTGPTYRPGRNLMVLSPVRPDGKVTPLTSFADGYVADCEVSYDGRKIIFCRREQKDPWWHIFEINADGTGLRQLTRGAYHDINPVYLPDGRILFASSRLGTRDEYHGYYCTGLHVMNADGGEIHPIATNVGRDNEPAILADGRIVFSRLEVFYSRLKTELTIHTCEVDGTQDMVVYGPERREFWLKLNTGLHGEDYAAQTAMTHRVLRVSQPQQMPDGRIICTSQGGLVLLGPPREEETLIPRDLNRAFTTPWPLADGRVLCASTLKAKKPKDVDLGLYLVEPNTGELTLVYNDPAWAEYEARPLAPRPVPPLHPAHHDRSAYSGFFVCSTVRDSREPNVPVSGRLVRLIEGVPVTGRHSTQTNPGEVWRNHGGTQTRVLGTFPVAADGSFFVEVPADRLVHFQVLDADKRVIGNQLTWIYVRPGETRSCVGCHEKTDNTSSLRRPIEALRAAPVNCLPSVDNFRYRAKMWHKGRLIPEAEIRTRSVRSINLIARE
ncbi:MAG: translocation protein TolB [Planctomycetes bacterium ADurb.Bin126]|nr:MAG: translocation protein TolB [Planctomycetes bacterium ADurb.Bin126]HOD81312.1 HEAT repeat domain-containing protein [Phycisphaerae bacterium]HQL74562.1 HEAT repeat domain-containing protein [Phycisphaerae bacterium]